MSGSSARRSSRRSRPARFALQVTIAQATHDKLRYAQALLGHAVPSGDLAQVLDRALDALIAKLEQRRFARTARAAGRAASAARTTRATCRPQVRRDGLAARRRPVHVRERAGPSLRGAHAAGVRSHRAVRARRPGDAGGLRLRCRAHNQLEAERAYGAEFMRHKRDASRKRAEAARATKTKSDVAPGTGDAQVSQERESATARHARQQEVIPWLRALGVRADEAKRAVAFDDVGSDAPLETRVRAALTETRARRRVPGLLMLARLHDGIPSRGVRERQSDHQ